MAKLTRDSDGERRELKEWLAARQNPAIRTKRQRIRITHKA